MNCSFENNELEIIERVYLAVWAQVEARDPQRDREKDQERRAALRERVLNFARSGQVEFDTLYKMVLMTIPQKWSRVGGVEPEGR
jgi:hypothetical protein